MEKPKYLQIKENIMEAVEGQSPNTPIPSEREIALQYDASRMTVRRAIEELVDEGVLYREKNVGTFISDKKIHKKIDPVMLEESNEKNTKYKILYFNMYYDIKNNQDILENLETKDGEMVLRIVRLVEKNEIPICIEEIFITRNELPEDNIDVLNEYLNFDNYIDKVSMKQVFVPMIVPTQYAKLLNIKINVPIIRIDNLISKKNGMPFMFIKSYYNPENKKIEITV